MQPAVGRQRLGGRLLVGVVALEDVRAAHEHLAVLGDLHLAARQRPADGAEPVLRDRVERFDGAVLGHAVALQHPDAGGVEELEDLGVDRRGTAQRELHAAAEEIADLMQDELVGERVLALEDEPRVAAAILAPGDLATDADRPVEDLRLRAAGLVGLGGRGSVDLLEDARHRRQVRRLDDLHVLDDLLGVAAPIGQLAAGVDREQLHDPRQHVGERQEDVQDVVAGRDLQALVDAVDVRDEVAVGEHAALRRPGRAGGVDDRRDVVGADRGNARVEVGVGDLRAGRAQLVERHRAAALALEAQHVLEAGQRVADLGELRELALVLAEEHAGARVVEHVLALLRRVGLVDRHHDCAGADRAEVGERPLGTRVGEDRDAIAWRDAEADQALRDGPHVGPELRIGGALPAAVLRIAHRRAAVAGGRAEDQRRQRPRGCSRGRGCCGRGGAAVVHAHCRRG